MRAERLVKTTCADRNIVRAVPVGAWRSPVSAPVWGTGGRGFKSRRPDQINQRLKSHDRYAPKAQGNSRGNSKQISHPMPRDGAIIFSDLVGKLEVLCVDL